jgi:hypothetical protein
MSTRGTLTLPPTIDHPTIAAAASEYRNLTERLATELHALDELRAKHEDAREADEQAAADAIRAGGRTPAPTHQRKSLDLIATKERQAEALGRAIGDSRGDLIAAVERHGAELARTLEQAVDAKRSAYTDAVDALADAHAELASATAMLAWLHRFTADPVRAQWTPGAYVRQVHGLTGQNGEPLDIAATIAALRDLPNPPAPTIPRMPLPSGASADAIPGRAA